MRNTNVGLVLMTLAGAACAADTPCTECQDSEALSVEAVYTAEMWHQASGGLATGERYLDNLDFVVEADGERLLGIPQTRLFAYLLYNNGHSINEDLTGTAQGVSNIEAVRATRLYELWTEWKADGGARSLRFGLYDLNSEFDSIGTAALFINPSHGIAPELSQIGENGPSIFPVTSLGARYQQFFGHWSLQAAVLDGVPGDPEHPSRTAISLSREDGALLIGEINHSFPSGARVGGGYWRHTARFETIGSLEDSAQPASNRNAGAYLLAETALLFAREGGRGLNMYARVGQAEQSINPIGRYYGVGATYSGPFAASTDHRIGVALAVAELGEPFRKSQAAAGISPSARERNCELTYRFGINDWLALQTDVQYIRHPNMEADRDDAWVVGIRLEASWSSSRSSQ